MTNTITLSLGGGSKLTVGFHETETPGLIVHGMGPFDHGYRLAHHSGALLGKFDFYEAAQAAATRLKDVANWTCPASGLQDEAIIWKAIDAIDAEDGDFVCAPNGLGAQVYAKRRAQRAAEAGGVR